MARYRRRLESAGTEPKEAAKALFNQITRSEYFGTGVNAETKVRRLMNGLTRFAELLDDRGDTEAVLALLGPDWEAVE